MLRIKEICKEKGILQTDLADRLGMSPQGLSMLINRNITIEVLNRLANALEVPISELFEKQQIELLIRYNGKIYQIPESKIIQLIESGDAIQIKQP